MTLDRRALMRAIAATPLASAALHARAQAAFETVKIITGFPPAGGLPLRCRGLPATPRTRGSGSRHRIPRR